LLGALQLLDIRVLSNVFFPQKLKVSEQVRMLCGEGLLIYTGHVLFLRYRNLGGYNRLSMWRVGDMGNM